MFTFQIKQVENIHYKTIHCNKLHSYFKDYKSKITFSLSLIINRSQVQITISAVPNKQNEKKPRYIFIYFLIKLSNLIKLT